MSRQTQLVPHWSERRKRYTLNLPPDISPTHKRQLLTFRTLAEAEEHVRSIKRHKEQFATSLPPLLPTQIVEIHRVYEMLQKAKISTRLELIVSQYIRGSRESAKSIPLSALIDEYVAARQHRHADYLRHFQILKKLTATLGNKLIVEIKHPEVYSLLEPLTDNAFNRNLTLLNVLYRYGAKKGYCKTNPLDAIEVKHVPSKEVVILTPEETFALLDYAHTHYPRYAAYCRRQRLGPNIF